MALPGVEPGLLPRQGSVLTVGLQGPIELIITENI